MSQAIRLHWAMRGGGINLGILASFEFETVEQGRLWGGARVYAEEQEHTVLPALDRFLRTGSDTNAQAFVIHTYGEQAGGWMNTVIMSHSTPADDSAVFDAFKALPHVVSTTAIRCLTDLTVEIDQNNPRGFRWKTMSLAIWTDLATMKEIAAIHREVAEQHQVVQGFVPARLFQPLAQATLPEDKIGNDLGIMPEECPLLAGFCDFLILCLQQF
jgi:hypothetical protein